MKKHLILILGVFVAIGIGFYTGDWRPAAVGVSALLASYHPKISHALGFEIGTVASGVGTSTTFDLTFCPQFISWIQTAAVDIKITILGQGVTWDVPATGITELGIVRQLGRFTNQYVLQIADGLIPGYQISLTVTNQVASTFTLYGHSENRGAGFIQGGQQVCLANSGIDFRNFYYLAFPSAGANDLFTVTWRGDGTNQQYRREELRARLQRYQNVINSSGYSIDNLSQEVSKVNFVPAAEQTIYYTRYIGMKNADNALVNQAG